MLLKKTTIALRFLFRKRLNISSDTINTQIKDFKYFVDEQNVENYNVAVDNNTENSFYNKKAVHPLFYTKISWQIIENLNRYLDKPINEAILKTIVHQSENIIFHQKLKIPTSLTVKSKIWSLSKHKKGTKMLIRFDYYSENELIATEYSGGLLFGVKLIGEGNSLADIPKTKRINNTAIWQQTIKIDKNLPYFYAQKAEIDAPIHTNPKFARSIGLPDIILQGTCTFAKSVNLVISSEFTRQTPKIKSVSAKFTGMIVPANNITVRLLKKDENALYFDVLNNKKEAVIKGGQILLC